MYSIYIPYQPKTVSVLICERKYPYYMLSNEYYTLYWPSRALIAKYSEAFNELMQDKFKVKHKFQGKVCKIKDGNIFVYDKLAVEGVITNNPTHNDILFYQKEIVFENLCYCYQKKWDILGKKYFIKDICLSIFNNFIKKGYYDESTLLLYILYGNYSVNFLERYCKKMQSWDSVLSSAKKNNIPKEYLIKNSHMFDKKHYQQFIKNEVL